jgi:hypothetical protein
LQSSKYSITNFRSHQNISTSEIVTLGSLQVQMTSHGLGSGIYGFINPDKAHNSLYNSKLTQSKIYMYNPLCLETDDDASDVSFFSFMLNKLIFDIYKNSQNLSNPTNPTNPTNQQIRDYFTKHQMLKENKLYGVLNKFNIDDVIDCINNFLFDYNKLIELGNQENYIPMPINYLLTKYYDGIYNIARDNASNGSVCYQYINPRSFVATKKKKILTGINLSIFK